MTEQEIFESKVKNDIEEFLNDIREDSFSKIKTALSCGALSEDSEFRKEPMLLARAVLMLSTNQTSANRLKLHHPEYIKEYQNLEKFI